MVEVITSEVSITIGALYFKYTITKFKDGNIECTTTKVEYGNFLLFGSLVQTVGKSCGGGLIDDTFYLKAGNLASILSGLTL